MEKVKRSIQNRLFSQFIILLSFMGLIGTTALICIYILKFTSEEIAYEYVEMAAIQDLRFSFNKTFIPAYNFLIYNNQDDLKNFRSAIDSVNLNLIRSKKVLSKSHNLVKLQEFNVHFDRFKHVLQHYENVNIDIKKNTKLIPLLDKEINSANSSLEFILDETEAEIDQYIITNKSATFHSTITIVFLSILLLVISYFIGTRFVRQITNPIKKLVNFTKKISLGDYSIMSDIKTHDEMEVLSDAFNSMIENLKTTTISKNYLNDILKSMHESVIVTDVHGKINIINKATNKMLGYTSEELKNKSFGIIINSKEKRSADFDYMKFYKNAKSNQEKIYRTKSNAKIPVLFSYSTIRNKKDQILGIVFVAHDLREKKRIENKLVRIRREQTIRINEAQEKERLRIAKDIHDGLGQTLTGISYYVDTYLGDNCESKDEFQKHVSKLQLQIDNAINESRSIAHEIIPILLKDFGLTVTVKNFIDQLNSIGKTQFVFNAFNLNNRLDEKIEKMFYRIIQEAVGNINKHSNAKNANIQIINHNESVSLVIVDDGVGFDYQATLLDSKKLGIGLVSMKERVEDFNGLFSVNTGKDKGTEILIEIPNL